MRRLPMFFVIDVSESMVGEPIDLMEKGIDNIISSLRQDPHSLETVYVSIIAFAGKAKVITPLIDLISFYPPKIPIGGGTSIGRGLDVLMAEIDQKIVKNTYETRGDWEPVVFLITDGKPTDQPADSILKWKTNYAKKTSLVAITLGTNADIDMLGEITENVFALENTDKNYFSKFVEWISASVKAQSQKIEQENSFSAISLDKASEAGLTFVEDSSSINVTDSSSVTLTGKCSVSSKPYLIKYSKPNMEGMERFVNSPHYILEGAFIIDNSYFEWSSENFQAESIDTSVLEGVPPCPHCGSGSAFAMCNCGKLLCVSNEELVTCPWCESKIRFNFERDGEGDSNFSINRGQG